MVRTSHQNLFGSDILSWLCRNLCPKAPKVLRRVFVILCLSITAFLAKGQLANSGWPMYLGNASASGQSTGAGAIPVVKWSFLASSSKYNVPIYPVIGPNGAIYIAASNNLYALNGETGAVTWTFSLGSGIGPPIVGFDGSLYIQSEGNLYALDGLTGQQKWSVTNVFSLTMGPSGDLYGYSQDSNGPTTIALDSTTGAIRWSVEIPGIETPTVGPGGTVYVETQVGLTDVLNALNPADGSVIWKIPCGPVIEDANGVLFEGDATAINPADGSVIWSSNQYIDNFVGDGVVVTADGLVVIAGHPPGDPWGAFAVLDASTGNTIW